MILGIGVDIVDISRIRSVYKRHGERFLKRAFTRGEVTYCLKKQDPIPSLAARFAAKEALVKSLGTGFSMGIGFKDIEVDRSKGRPYIRLDGNARKQASEMNVSGIHLSLSHEKGHAVAVVIIEK